MPGKMRDWLPHLGWPVYDLRRRKFGICIQEVNDERLSCVYAHIEGDRFPVRIEPFMNIYEYPKFYDNDEVEWEGAQHLGYKDSNFFVKHTHYHVPTNTWEYTLMQRGSFDRHVAKGHSGLTLINRYESPI